MLPREASARIAATLGWACSINRLDISELRSHLSSIVFFALKYLSNAGRNALRSSLLYMKDSTGTRVLASRPTLRNNVKQMPIHRELNPKIGVHVLGRMGLTWGPQGCAGGRLLLLLLLLLLREREREASVVVESPFS
jgi:hypothetical protein